MKEKDSKTTLAELYEEYNFDFNKLCELLLNFGVPEVLLKEHIEDLKTQMYFHENQEINDLIADIINLEVKIERMQSCQPTGEEGPSM